MWIILETHFRITLHVRRPSAYAQARVNLSPEKSGCSNKKEFCTHDHPSILLDSRNQHRLVNTSNGGNVRIVGY